MTPEGRVTRLLRFAAHASDRRPRLVIAVSIIVTALAVVLVSRLHVASDISQFLPRGVPAARAFQRFQQAFGYEGKLYILLEQEPGEPAENLTAVADAVAGALRASPLIDRVELRTYAADRATMTALLPKLLLLGLSPDQARRIVEKLSAEALRSRIDLNRRLLLRGGSPALPRLVRHDPLGLREIFMEGSRDEEAGRWDRVDVASGYYLTRDHTALLIHVHGVQRETDIAFAHRLVDEARRVCDRALDGQGLSARVRASFTGGYVVAVEESTAMRADIKRCILLSTCSVILILLIAFRNLRLLGYVTISMAIGILWGYAAASCLLENLSILSCAAGAILIGLAVDLPIHLTQRFFAAVRSGTATREAVRTTVEQTGKSILIASFTSVAGFSTFFFTGSRGLADMAVVAICGIVAVTLVMLFLLPALLARGMTATAVPRTREEGLWDAAAALLKRHREPLLTVLILGTAICVIILVLPIGRLSFVADPVQLKAEGTAERVLARIQTKFGSSFNYMILVSRGSTPEAASGRLRGLIPLFRELRRQGSITSYEGIFTFTVSPEEQREAVAILREIDADRAEERLRLALEENGFRVGAFADAFSSLRELLNARPVSLAELDRLGGLPFLRKFLRRDGEAYLSVAYLALADRFRHKESTLDLVRRIETEAHGHGPSYARPAGADVTATGMKVLHDELEEHLRGTIGLISTLAILFITIVVSLAFRHFGWTFLAMLPVTVGVIWFLTILKLLTIPFNLLNVGILPMVIGLGIDDGVHMVCRFTDEKPRTWRPVFSESGRAVLLTTLTTMCGFGSLVFAAHRGLASVGTLAVIGMAACLVASLTLLPASLSYGGEGNRTGQRRSDDRMELFRPTIYGSTLMPEPLSYFFTWLSAQLVCHYAVRWRTAVASNLRRITGELPAREREKLVVRTFLNYGVKIRDYVLFSRNPLAFSRRRLRESSGIENVERTLAGGGGAVLVSPHLGFWDLGGSFLRERGYRVKAISFHSADAAIERFRERVRRRMGIEVIYIGRQDKGLDDTLRLAQALRQGCIVAMLGDRVLAGPSIEVPFFGTPRPFPLGPALLARISGAPLLPVFIVRTSRKGYRAIAESPLAVSAEGDAREALGEAVRQMVAVFERYIAAYPDQWYNFFPYWDEPHGEHNAEEG